MSLQFVQSLVISRRSGIASLFVSFFHSKDGREKELNNSTYIPECVCVWDWVVQTNSFARHKHTSNLETSISIKRMAIQAIGTPPCHLLSQPSLSLSFLIDCLLFYFYFFVTSPRSISPAGTERERVL